MSWDRDPVLTIGTMIDEITSPKARSARLAAFAEEQIAAAREINRRSTGRDVAYEVTVDRTPGKPIAQVKPDGVVFVEFELIVGVIEWIEEELRAASPVLTGAYQRSHILFADGIEHQAGSPIPAANEYTFVNAQPYARKVERGQSKQAADGVYQVIAALARRRFVNSVAIKFSWRSVQDSGLVQYEGVSARAPVTRDRRGRYTAGSGAGIVTASQRQERNRERATRFPAIIVRVR
jgi:hypothetical protein